MFTLAICTILNGYTQVNIKILLLQSYHTTCVSFSCEFSLWTCQKVTKALVYLLVNSFILNLALSFIDKM